METAVRHFSRKAACLSSGRAENFITLYVWQIDDHYESVKLSAPLTAQTMAMKEAQHPCECTNTHAHTVLDRSTAVSIRKC